MDTIILGNITYNQTNDSKIESIETSTNSIFTSTQLYENSVTPTVNQNDTNFTTDSQDDSPCETWIVSQNSIYQVGCVCFALAFLVPAHFRYNVFLIRGFLSLGSVILLLWGSLYMCLWDIMGWYTVIFFVNMGQLVYNVYHAYPVKIEPELVTLYQFFKPFKLQRKYFRDLVSSASITTLYKGAKYVEEYQSQCNQKLSILLSGRLKVTCESLFLHYVEPNQFVDSPEYEAFPPDVEEDGEYQVSITAVEDCRLLTWDPKDFSAYLKTNTFVKSLITNLMGKDITTKLYQVQELLRHPPIEEPERKQSSSDNTSPLLAPRPPPTFRNSISIPNIPTNVFHHKQRFSIHDIAGHSYKPCKQPWDTWEYTTAERSTDKCDHLIPSNYHSAFREEKPSFYTVYYKQACQEQYDK